MALEKISLSDAPTKAPVTPVKATRLPRFSLRPTKKLSFVLLGVFVVLIILSIAIFIPARAILASANKTYTQAKTAWDAIKKQDVGLTKEELVKTRASLVQTQKELKGLAWTGYVPLVGLYYRDAEHGMNAASAGLDAAETVVDAILPYADV